MEVTVSDRTLALVGSARPVRCNSEDAGIGQTIGRWVTLQLDAGWVRPVSADVGRTEETLCDRTLAVFGQA